MRILLATDSFPPHCGGSGWSTWELARGLRARGHDILVVQPRPGRPDARGRSYDGFEVDEVPSFAPPVPFVRNYFKNERLWAQFADHLVDVARRERIDVVHGQHVLTVPAAVRAAERAGIPSVATVRDYWPVCYWGTLLLDPQRDRLCPGCSATRMRDCLRPRPGHPATLPFIPYMRANLQRRQQALARADAVIAVSRRIASDLTARSAGLDPSRIALIPNPFDVSALREAAASQPRPIPGDYVLYVGKLEVNKGADLLPYLARRASLRLPLVVVGDGALHEKIATEARRLQVDVRVTGWLPRELVLAWMASARCIVFPSRGPESLSRVLIESAALGVPAAAMETGGTADIVEHDATGLLSTTPEGLARDVAALVGDRDLAARLGEAAHRHVAETFDTSVVVERIERLYRQLIEHRSMPRPGAAWQDADRA